jgi:hypothetical protein
VCFKLRLGVSHAQQQEEDLFVFNDTIEGPRAQHAQQACLMLLIHTPIDTPYVHVHVCVYVLWSTIDARGNRSYLCDTESNVQPCCSECNAQPCLFPFPLLPLPLLHLSLLSLSPSPLSSPLSAPPLPSLSPLSLLPHAKANTQQRL